MSRSQVSRVEALENRIEVAQRAPLGTLWLCATDFATDEEELAIRDACCEAMRARGYTPMVLTFVAPAPDGGATASRPASSNPDPFIVTPWATFGSERAADHVAAASALDERAVIETQHEEPPPAAAHQARLELAFVAPEPEPELEEPEPVATATPTPPRRAVYESASYRRRSGGQFSWMR